METDDDDYHPRDKNRVDSSSDGSESDSDSVIPASSWKRTDNKKRPTTVDTESDSEPVSPASKRRQARNQKAAVAKVKKSIRKQSPLPTKGRTMASSKATRSRTTYSTTSTTMFNRPATGSSTLISKPKVKTTETKAKTAKTPTNSSTITNIADIHMTLHVGDEVQAWQKIDIDFANKDSVKAALKWVEMRFQEAEKAAAYGGF
ncbi:uncharacterized protein BDZ99DRAFT_471235 [Mytilinidion resinicola]|uniref:Uncharacterized protein n=1 Tax=Mytilinidion resinicola TaxID=574789 RepID=A0A6A6Z4H4_9PEZI|nr:uncharacterized protein BDZ99DRAFT_471235 [Mytilinidion resinicola]KAF2815930.1 hypothetical protein BDZ99DRAFT_471235 [Mytilinidion resinicola]